MAAGRQGGGQGNGLQRTLVYNTEYFVHLFRRFLTSPSCEASGFAAHGPTESATLFLSLASRRRGRQPRRRSGWGVGMISCGSYREKLLRPMEESFRRGLIVEQLSRLPTTRGRGGSRHRWYVVLHANKRRCVDAFFASPVNVKAAGISTSISIPITSKAKIRRAS